MFKIAPDFKFPEIDYVKVNNSGGSLKLGVYQFGIALGDENLNFTNCLLVTNPIPVVKGTINGDFNKIEGGNPLNETQPTTKSISISFTNIDTNYKYIKIYECERKNTVRYIYICW